MSENKYVLNPKTNRYIVKGTARYNRLLKEGVISANVQQKPPAVILEKKVKAVANVNNLSKVEINDLYEQLKSLKLKSENVLQRRGRKEGMKGDPDRPKTKEVLNPKKKPPFKVNLKAPQKAENTEYEMTEIDV